MQAVVKMPRIEITVKGDIPDKLLSFLEREYGNNVRLIEDDDDEIVNIFETEWYQNIKVKTTPGDNLRIYRQNHGLTQAQLGERLGNVPRQIISNLERGSRPISLKMARKLAEIFNVSPDKFIQGLPFSMEIPNQETRETFEKTDRGEDLESCRDTEDLFKKQKL